jgi:hypothetical protein
MARVIGTLAAAMASWDRPSPVRADPSRLSPSSPPSPSSPSRRVYCAASVLALQLGIGTEDDYKPAPPELCTVITAQSKYNLLRSAGLKKRAEQDEQALRIRRRRPSFLPKELERMETALKGEGAKGQAAGSAPSSPSALRRRSMLHRRSSTDEGSNKTVAASCSHTNPLPLLYPYVSPKALSPPHPQLPPTPPDHP